MALKGLMTFAPGNLRSYIPNMELKGKRVERKAMSMKSFRELHGNNILHAVQSYTVLDIWLFKILIRVGNAVNLYSVYGTFQGVPLHKAGTESIFIHKKSLKFRRIKRFRS